MIDQNYNSSAPQSGQQSQSLSNPVAPAPRDLFEFGKTVGRAAEAKLIELAQRIFNSPSRRERVPSPVYLQPDILSMITDEKVRDFLYEANGRVGAFTPIADNGFVFATLETFLEVEPDTPEIERELISAIGAATADQVIVLTGQPVIATTTLDANHKGLFGAIRITKMRSRFYIHGAGRRLDS